MNQNSEIFFRSATNADCNAVQELVFSVLREYGLTPEIDGTDSDLTNLEDFYINRGGVFEVFIAPDGQIVGSVGLYPIDEETIELRKMYLKPEARGSGLGRATLARMVEKSRELGYRRLYLETATVLREAVRLYEKFGFRPTCEKHTPRCDAAYEYDLRAEA